MSRLDDEIRARVGASKSEEEVKAGALVLEMPRRKDPYQAFSAPTKDPLIRLTIYAKTMYLMPQYQMLYDVVFAAGFEFVGLVFAHQRIRIYGRNLVGLVAGLQTNSVEWIRELTPFFELPEDDGTLPVITEIQIEGAAISPFE